MRTTVTLDSDVERLLKDAAHRQRRSFKETLNDAVRVGLATRTVPQQVASFTVRARPMGIRSGIDPAKLSETADDFEVEAFLDLTRKLAEGEKPSE